MDDGCEMSRALKVVAKSSSSAAHPAVFPDGKSDAARRKLGIRWTEELIEAASPHRVSGLIRRGLSNPAADQLAGQLRSGLFEIWSAAVEEELDTDSASWLSFIKLEGLTREASIPGRD